jgi:hypothetical protein
VLAALGFLALANCSKSGGGPSGSASASAAPVGSAAPQTSGACDVVSCANFSGAPSYTAGKAATIPEMPPPPPGASLCGESTSFGPTNYYTTSQSPADVIAYYEKELPPKGFTLKPHGNGPRACSLMLDFHKKPLEIGNVVAFVGGFSVMYLGK